jgi:hypothetical protein
MSENFSGPWKETFCIHKCWKSLPVPGMRHFTFIHAIKVWPLEGDLAWGPEFSGMGEFKRWHSGDQKTFPTFGNAKDLYRGNFVGFSVISTGKKQQHGHHAATFIMQPLQQQYCRANNSRNTSKCMGASAWVPATARRKRPWMPC